MKSSQWIIFSGLKHNDDDANGCKNLNGCQFLKPNGYDILICFATWIAINLSALNVKTYFNYVDIA